MRQYLVYETQLVEVTFVKEVMANHENEAIELSHEGEGTLLGVALGDISPMSVTRTNALQYADHNIPAHFYKEPK